MMTHIIILIMMNRSMFLDQGGVKDDKSLGTTHMGGIMMKSVSKTGDVLMMIKIRMMKTTSPRIKNTKDSERLVIYM